jgi:hypothetical protein
MAEGEFVFRELINSFFEAVYYYVAYSALDLAL